jgi:hypothetical protein
MTFKDESVCIDFEIIFISFFLLNSSEALLFNLSGIDWKSDSFVQIRFKFNILGAQIY